jgi:hypothetical protein
VSSAATTPHQVEAIDRFIWSASEEDPRLLPCGTLHAGYETYKEELAWMRSHGIHGVKIHPECQRFPLDDDRLLPMYEEMERTDMFLLAHMGDPRDDLSGPKRMLPIAQAFPKLRCIAAHLGDWGTWDLERVRPLLKLSNVYTDISSTFSYVQDKEPIYKLLSAWDPTRVFYGSDYPIWCPKKELDKVQKLGLEPEFLEDVLWNNFARFYHYQEL